MQHRTDKDFKYIDSKKKNKYLLLSITIAVLGTFLVMEYDQNPSQLLFFAMIFTGFIFAISCIVGIKIENKKYKNYVCKECGSELNDYDLADKDEYVFVCEKCSITWHTETFQPHD